MAATYQRVTGGRLLLNIVVGGDDAEQRRYGDFLSKDERYAQAGEFLHVLRAAWEQTTTSPASTSASRARTSRMLRRRRTSPSVARRTRPSRSPRGSATSSTWGEPPEQVAEKLDRVRAAADRHGRTLRFGIRVHVITRDTADEAWAEADRLVRGLDPGAIAAVQAKLSRSQSEGQRRMVALHNGRTDRLEVSPNLWAGVGLVRGGAGTALVGSHEEVADRVAEYHELGLGEFILSGSPHLEEAYRAGEGLLPVLRRGGLVGDQVTAVS